MVAAQDRQVVSIRDQRDPGQRRGAPLLEGAAIEARRPARAGHQHEGLVEERLELDVTALAARRRQHQVELVALGLVEERLRQPGARADAQPLLDERRQGRQGARREQIGGPAEEHGAGEGAAGAAQGVDARLERVERAGDRRRQLVAGRGGGDAARQTDEERPAEAHLERLELLRDRRLRQVQAARGVRERAVAVDGDEAPQERQISHWFFYG